MKPRLVDENHTLLQSMCKFGSIIIRLTISYSKAYWSVQDYTHTQTSGKDTNVCKCENDYQS